MDRFGPGHPCLSRCSSGGLQGRGFEVFSVRQDRQSVFNTEYPSVTVLGAGERRVFDRLYVSLYGTGNRGLARHEILDKTGLFS